MSMIDTFENMLAAGQDTALLRFSLGNEYLKQGRAADAVRHLGRAVHQDPAYSAAWKLYARARAESGRPQDAQQAYEKGISAAEQRGDVQAAKEMRVFLRRLQKAAEN